MRSLQSHLYPYFFAYKLKLFLDLVIKAQHTSFSAAFGTGVVPHLNQMDLPTLMSRTSLFPILGVLGGIFHFFPDFY